jgi:hypothetical protein
VTYVFNEDAADFLSIATRSGNDFKFEKAVLLFPEGGMNGSAVPSVVSKEGFLSSYPALAPYFVRLSTAVRMHALGQWHVLPSAVCCCPF